MVFWFGRVSDLSWESRRLGITKFRWAGLTHTSILCSEAQSRWPQSPHSQKGDLTEDTFSKGSENALQINVLVSKIDWHLYNKLSSTGSDLWK